MIRAAFGRRRNKDGAAMAQSLPEQGKGREIRMIGAIIGDIVGSRFEFNNIKTKEFELFHSDCDFTDDTVMTCAVAETLMRYEENGFQELSRLAADTLHEIGRKHPFCGYGGMFFRWMFSDDAKPYGSFGNGSAMRISPVGDAARNVEEAKLWSQAVTGVTHDHPEGLKGAECAAVLNVSARQADKAALKQLAGTYYELPYTVEEYRTRISDHGQETCPVSLPQSLTCFFEADSFEDTIRNCISIGGDCDTTAAIAGGIAASFYGVPDWMKTKAMSYLTDDLAEIVERFDTFLLKGE